MKNDYTNSFILNALELPLIYDFDTLSDSMGLSKRLLYLLSNRSENYYTNFSIRKKNNKMRTIHSPSYSMKLVQRWILNEILEKVKVSNEAMAFVKGDSKGILKNAESHKYNLFFLEMDIRDFYTSIKKNRVHYLFRNLGYNQFVSEFLANLCTYKDYLPQGAVSSPYISNLICYRLDLRLNGLSAKRDIVYTRYADDLTFSCNNKDDLKKICCVIKDIVQDEGFQINDEKTRFLSPASKRVVTGITIHDIDSKAKLKANKETKRKVRAMIHHAIVGMDYSKADIIRGYIAHIDYVERGYKGKMVKYINSLIKSKQYSMHNSVVEAYNQNKILKDAEEMVLANLNSYEIVDGQLGDEFMSDNFLARTEFLIKNEYKDDIVDS